MAHKFSHVLSAYGHHFFSEIKQVSGFHSIKLTSAGYEEPKLRISEPYMSFYRYIDQKGRFSTKNSHENWKKPIIVPKIAMKSGQLPDYRQLSSIRGVWELWKCYGQAKRPLGLEKSGSLGTESLEARWLLCCRPAHDCQNRHCCTSRVNAPAMTTESSINVNLVACA